MPSYIPARDADLAAWSANFAAQIATDYADFGLTSGQQTAYAALNTAFQAAYTLAVNPATRTKPTVAAKDVAKFDLIAYARELAAVVQAFPAITPELLADLGLTVRDTTPTPIPVPTTTPLLSIVAGTNLALTLRYSDELTPASRKMPFGAIGLQLWALVNDTPPVSPDTCLFIGTHTKNPVQLSFGPTDGGKLCTVYGRWVTRRGLVGPWSLAASMTVPSGT